jgi:hypothetical protein
MYYHFRKWPCDGSLKRVWQHSIASIRHLFNMSELNLDGSHAIPKKGGESIAYQGRKQAKPGPKRMFNQEVYKKDAL